MQDAGHRQGDLLRPSFRCSRRGQDVSAARAAGGHLPGLSSVAALIRHFDDRPPLGREERAR
eukprot:6197276-Pyramimonas_sp.AAC.1